MTQPGPGYPFRLTPPIAIAFASGAHTTLCETIGQPTLASMVGQRTFRPAATP